MADVICHKWLMECHWYCVVDVNTTLLSWLMLLPICVMWQMLLPHGRCYSHKDGGLADVIANVADVMATGSLYLF